MRLHCCVEMLRFLPQFRAGEGGGGHECPQWAPGLVATAGPQRVHGAWGPGKEVIS